MVKVIVSIWISRNVAAHFDQEGLKADCSIKIRRLIMEHLGPFTDNYIYVHIGWQVHEGYLNNRITTNMVVHKSESAIISETELREVAENHIPSKIEAIALVNRVQNLSVTGKIGNNIFNYYE